MDKQLGHGIDLHMHTTASDGTDTPEVLLQNIRSAGIGIFSITDHDSILSCIAMRQMLTAERNAQPIRFIPGVEFSCKDEEGKYHILGCGYQREDGEVFKTTEETHRIRMWKLEARLEHLKKNFGFTFAEEDLAKLRGLANPGKPHIGNLMVQYGYAETRKDAIQNFLNQFSPPDSHIRPETAVEAILADGGIPVLAHAIYGDGDQLIMGEELETRIRRLKGFGLRGLECFYSGFVPRQQKLMLDLAERYDMYATAGSDYHGSNKLIMLGDTGLEDRTEPAFPVRLQAFLDAVG